MSEQAARDAADEEFLDRLRHDDAGAFSALMTRHGAAVYRYAWALADEPSQVDDLVQETFLVLWKQRRRLQVIGDSVLPWLLTTCRFTAYNSNRRSRRERTRPLDGITIDASQTASDANDELVWVRGEISRMSDTDQQLCQLCLVEGRSYREAADILRISPATARKRIQRTRERLVAARALDE